MNQSSKLMASNLCNIPLWSGLTKEQMEKISNLFQRVDAKPGDHLFEAGDPASDFYLLVRGEIVLRQADQETHRLHPPSVIGELGAITGLRRNSKAIAAGDVEIWKTNGHALGNFFEEEKEIGLRVQQNLLAIAGYKINRDQTRLQDMRKNIIKTQKEMKRMREFVLKNEESAVSGPVHDILEDLIKQNRRVNYRVEPPPAMAATLQMDNLPKAAVVEISRTHVSFALGEGELPKPKDHIVAILCLDGPEIPISGTVLRVADSLVVVELDLLIEEYVAVLEGYLTRLQMLDFLV